MTPVAVPADAVAWLLLVLPAVGLGIGENRKNGALRLVYGILYYIVVFAVGWVLLLLYGGFWLVDVVYQMVTNKDGLGSKSFGSRLFDRQTKFREWLIFNDGEPPSWRR